MDVSVHEAKTQLSRLLDLVAEGEDIIIHRHGKSVARIVPVLNIADLPLGAMRGEFEMTEGWDKPLTDDETEAFCQGKR